MDCFQRSLSATNKEPAGILIPHKWLKQSALARFPKIRWSIGDMNLLRNLL